MDGMPRDPDDDDPSEFEIQLPYSLLGCLVGLVVAALVATAIRRLYF